MIIRKHDIDKVYYRYETLINMVGGYPSTIFMKQHLMGVLK